MASIIKRGKNSFRLIVELGYDSKGKRIKRLKTIKVDDALLKTTKKLREYLDMELAKFKMEVEAGEYIAPEKMRVADFVTDWETKYAKNHLGPRTLDTYKLHLRTRIIPSFGHLRLDQVQPIHIVRFLDELSNDGQRKDKLVGGLSSGTIEIIYRVLRNIFNRAVEWRLIKNNPVAAVKKPKVERKEMKVYDEKTTRMLFEALEGETLQWRVMITLALTTGLRKGELLGLEWKHFDLESGTLEVRQSLSFTRGGGYHLKEPKTRNSIRKLSLPKSIISDLKTYRHQCNKERMQTAELWEGGKNFFVFTTWHGKPLNPYSVRTWWVRFLKRHSLPFIRFHDLRHTSATLLINQGIHAKIISSRLGHANILTTMNIYGHALQEADQIAANSFDALFQEKEISKKA